MRILKISVITTFIFIFLNSCSSLQQLADMQQPTLSVDDVRVTGFNLREVEMTFDMEIDNPNPVSLTLNSYNYDFKIADNSFVSGNQPLNSSIAASGQNIVSVPVTFTFQELFNSFNILREQNETSYSFLADLEVQVPVLGLVTVPVDKTGTFPVVKIPTISLDGFRVTDLSFSKAEVELDLKVNNPNSFGMNIQGLNYGVELNGISPVSGEISQSVSVNERSSETITIPATFNLAELGLSAYRLLRSDEPISYSLVGNAEVGADLPFFEISSFQFDRSGEIDINR